MKTRIIGSSGLTVGALGLGCMGMSHLYDSAGRDDARSTEVLREAPGLGVTLIDTAAVYGPFLNESLVGAAFEGRRDEIVLATKCGLSSDTDGVTVRDARPDTIVRECEESLRRLRTDVIDLYQLHRVDPEVPLEDSWGTMADLQRQGKVRFIGLSEVTLDEVRLAHAIAPVTSVQSELSLWTRQWIDDVLPWTAENDVAFLPYSPLGRGFLTGAISAGTEFAADDMRSGNPRFQPSALSANQALVEEVRAIGAAHDATPAQVALAWVLAQGPQVIPIPGTKRSERLRENAAAADLELSDDELRRLTDLPPAEGTRY